MSFPRRRESSTTNLALSWRGTVSKLATGLNPASCAREGIHPVGAASAATVQKMITSLSRLKAAPTEQDHGVEAVTLVVLNGKMRLKAWLLSFFAVSICLCPLQAAAYEYEGENLTLTLSGYLESGARYACDNDTPDEDPSTELGIDLNADIGSKASFKLFFQVIDDGKVIDPGNGILFNEFNKIYQDKNPCVDIDEAYLDLFTDSMDFRIGIQKFA